MVCFCGHSHDALVQTQHKILPGQGGGAKSKGKGKSQVSAQGNTSESKGKGKVQQASLGNVVESPQSAQSQWRSHRKRGAGAISEDCGSDAPQTELQERTQTLQAVLNSIKGRSDPYAVDLRSMSLEQLAKLRLEANEAKSLPQQISILQQVLQRKEAVFSEAQSKMKQCMTNLEVAREKCMAADASLSECKDKLNLLVSKCATDVIPAPAQNALSALQVNSLLNLGSLLPAEMAKGFQEAMMHIQGLMQSQPPPANADIDLESGSEAGAGGFVNVSSSKLSSSTGSGGSPSSDASPGAFIREPCAAARKSNLVLPSGWGRGRGRPSEAPSPAAPPKTDGRSRTPIGGRSESLDSAVRRRLRGKQQDPYLRAPSEAPSDNNGHPSTGARYFSHTALATDSGAASVTY
jgi:hypothetical protein